MFFSSLAINLLKRIALFILTVLITACSTNQETPVATPNLQALRLAYSPDSHPALAAFKQCADAQPELALLADEIPVSVMDQSRTDLWLRLDVPNNWGGYAVQLAAEKIVLVVNPKNQTRSLDLEEIQSIFSGQFQSWGQVGGQDLPIQVWVLPPEDEARQIVDQNLLANQTISDQAFLAPSPSLMLEAIANDPDAIGYLPQAWTDPRVKSIPVPMALRSSLEKPLLALSPGEPDDQVRTLLACLQHGPGQPTLQARYNP